MRNTTADYKSSYGGPYETSSNYVAYDDRTQAGKTIQDLGGIGGLLGIASNVATTIETNQQNRVQPAPTTPPPSGVDYNYQFGNTNADAPPLNDTDKGNQTLLIIGLIVGVAAIVGVLLFVNKKPAPTA